MPVSYHVTFAPATSLFPTAHLALATLGFGDLDLAGTCHPLTVFLLSFQSRDGAASSRSSIATHLGMIDSVSLRDFFRVGTQS